MRIAWIGIEWIRIGGICIDWIYKGMCGIRHANNLVKIPATKYLSRKKGKYFFSIISKIYI